MKQIMLLGILIGLMFFAPIFGRIDFNKKTIGIIIPVNYEFKAFNDIMDIESGKAKTIGNLTFYTHIMGDKKVVIVKSQFSKVNAAIATTMLINDFGADYIICVGTSGGIAKDLKIGDIIVSEKLMQYDVAEEDDDSYELMTININDNDAYIWFEADPYLRQMSLKSSETADFIPINGKDIDVKEGSVGTADVFASGEKYLNFISQWNLDCAEMEGAAVAQVCYKFGKPFVVLRTISNFVVNSEGDYDKYAYDVTKNIAILIKEMIPQI